MSISICMDIRIPMSTNTPMEIRSTAMSISINMHMSTSMNIYMSINTMLSPMCMTMNTGEITVPTSTIIRDMMLNATSTPILKRRSEGLPVEIMLRCALMVIQVPFDRTTWMHYKYAMNNTGVKYV
jgi:hypothetical protein